MNRFIFLAISVRLDVRIRASVRGQDMACISVTTQKQKLPINQQLCSLTMDRPLSSLLEKPLTKSGLLVCWNWN